MVFEMEIVDAIDSSFGMAKRFQIEQIPKPPFQRTICRPGHMGKLVNNKFHETTI